MTEALHSPEYKHRGAHHLHSHAYLIPALDDTLRRLKPERVFDLGCGAGSIANHMSKQFEVVGVDLSTSGIAQANEAYPHINLAVGSAYDDLAARYGQFKAVVSLEVVEHLLDPRLYARRLYDLVAPGGAAIVSTPFHGYWKNLALAITGRMDRHFTALWDGGHIKFWSVRTLTLLLREAGFEDLEFHFVGRVPQLAKSMVVIARRPTA